MKIEPVTTKSVMSPGGSMTHESEYLFPADDYGRAALKTFVNSAARKRAHFYALSGVQPRVIGSDDQVYPAFETINLGRRQWTELATKILTSKFRRPHALRVRMVETQLSVHVFMN